ncbi:MAG: helix-turn-helix domain-containing protein, partial [Actinomycetota bacterium]|nr:helix-turn-helix domain-containing protein [Actinomycetota bacterium]
VARAMRLIADGVVDRDGVQGLASRLGYSARQVERHLRAELGAGPLALARAQRAQTARLLIETTNLTMAQVAMAAGFSSIRSFNDTVLAVFATSPTDLRRRAAPGQPVVAPGTLRLRLAFRSPLQPDNLFGHLAATAVAGVEEWREGAYRRTLRLPHGNGIVSLAPAADHIDCRLSLGDMRDLAAAINRCRRLLDLDADPVAVDDQLGGDPALSASVASAPGLRVPRCVDPDELAIRAVLGQQVSTAAARTHASRLVKAHGERVVDPDGGLSDLWPPPSSLVDLDPETLALPRSRRATIVALADALGSGRVDLGPSADWERARTELLALGGVGPWTAEIIAMRGLGDPDAFPVTDLGVMRGAAAMGLDAMSARLTRRADAWRPWRAYAVQHLWAALDHAVNRIPA